MGEECENLKMEDSSVCYGKMAPIDLSYRKEKNGVQPMQKTLEIPLSEHGQYTLRLDGVFGDNKYLLSMWKQCKLIDTFFYTNCDDGWDGDTEENNLYRTKLNDNNYRCGGFIPAHRLVICAYSQYCFRFFEKYPKQSNVLDQVPTLDNGKSINHLAQIACSTMPVLTLNIPRNDLYDLVTLMYHGTLKVDCSRINSIIKSACMLQVNGICFSILFFKSLFFSFYFRSISCIWWN